MLDAVSPAHRCLAENRVLAKVKSDCGWGAFQKTDRSGTNWLHEQAPFCTPSCEIDLIVARWSALRQDFLRASIRVGGATKLRYRHANG